MDARRKMENNISGGAEQYARNVGRRGARPATLSKIEGIVKFANRHHLIEIALSIMVLAGLAIAVYNAFQKLW